MAQKKTDQSLATEQPIRDLKKTQAALITGKQNNVIKYGPN